MQVNVQVTASVAATRCAGAELACLYDMNDFGGVKWITHGARAGHWAIPGRVIDFPIWMHMMSDNVDRVTASVWSSPPDFQVGIVFEGSEEASLTIPYIK